MGIGEEDGDLTWRYIQKYGRSISNLSISGLENYADETVHSYKSINIKCHSGTKYSLFNRKFMLGQKYKSDPNGIKGMFEHPVNINGEGSDQHPNELFYRKHKGEL